MLCSSMAGECEQFNVGALLVWKSLGITIQRSSVLSKYEKTFKLKHGKSFCGKPNFKNFLNYTAKIILEVA